MRRRSIAGLTLIELMVALAVVSVLGILAYRAVATATESRTRLAAEYQRWADITRFMQMAESDLLQAVARPASPNASTTSLLLAPIDTLGGLEINFIKLDGARATARRVGYRFDGGGTQIALERWPSTDGQSMPTRDVVLDGVKALRLTCIASKQRQSLWPPAQAQAPTAMAAPLPDAVEIELELADAGTLRRVIALR